MKVELFRLYAVYKYALRKNTCISILLVLTDTCRIKGIMGSLVDLI